MNIQTPAPSSSLSGSDVAFESSLGCARNATINPDNALAFSAAHDLDIAIDLDAEFGVRT
jgi:hypothetical protein